MTDTTASRDAGADPTGTTGRVRLRRVVGDDRVVAGVAGGVARTLGVDPVLIRIAFVVLTLASGMGLLVYLAAVAFVPVATDDDTATVAAPPTPRAIEQAVGIGLVTVGVLLLLRRIGLFLPDEIVWPAAVIGVGAAIGWSRIDGRTTDLLEQGRTVVVRVVAGALLLAVGIGIFVALNERVVVATQIVAAVLVTTGGVVLLAGPWIVRLGRQLGEERTERIRADERAAVAAHLHDSVLQTLALIQRRADSPSDTIALARRQERELRTWLYGDPRDDTSGTFATALRGLADEVEADHAIAVEVVVVGDAPLDLALTALVAAVREAVVNAAKHSGAPTVSVYGELRGRSATAYVRDRGQGFDPAAVPADRRGLADSVVGRVERHGGSAQVWSATGEGTEVTLSVPIDDVAPGPGASRDGRS